LNYLRIYSEFIADRLARTIDDKESERHHIIPRRLGGTNDQANIIRLAFSDHLFAHLLLAKIYRGQMATAANIMLIRGAEGKRGRNARIHYSWVRRLHRANMSKGQKDRMRNPALRLQISSALKGRKKDPEAINKRTATRLAKNWRPSMEARQKMSKSWKLNPAAVKAMQQANRGKPLSPDHRRSIAQTLKGRPHSPARIAAIRDGRRRKNNPGQLSLNV
jgi:hypothetical protein